MQTIIRKSCRVADESMLQANAADHQFPIFVAARTNRRHNHGWISGISAVISILLSPFSLLSCFSQPGAAAADGVWVSAADFSHFSEINHLMVNDSMRYAILM